MDSLVARTVSRSRTRPGRSHRTGSTLRSARPLAILALAASVTLTVTACGAFPARADAVAPQAAPVTAPGAAPIAVPEQYIVGPGDTLRVVVSQNPDLNAEVPVRPDGKISTPLANDVVAVGKTPTQLAHDIEAALSQFLRAPSVSVIVSNPVGSFGQVRVMGRGVATPRGFPYRSGMTVLDLIQEVGGLSQFASGNRAKIIRSGEQGTREIKVRLNDLLNKGRISENVKLEPGDILVIPETLF